MNVHMNMEGGGGGERDPPYGQRGVIDDEQFHVLRELSGGKSNVDGSFLFVSCQYPHLDTSLPQGGYALGYTLQLVIIIPFSSCYSLVLFCLTCCSLSSMAVAPIR